MAKNVLYKSKMFNPKTIYELLLFADSVVIAEAPDGERVYMHSKQGKIFVDHDGPLSKVHLETDKEESAVETFWLAHCGERIISETEYKSFRSE